ncbi:phosphotransferase [Nocardia mexicana]|uniref:Phosphotransferase family enzyme n=1 Tax=Nocardia mexicana TaxID=279262 RepID=A0A370H338_9NOCA|nr:phosphotransferase [Nocardia mexicana]RDI50064.1 phosphotransferase family enzyme [Nocardia mexicana]
MMQGDIGMNAPDTLLQETVEPILGWAVKELVAQGITVTGPGEERRRRDWTLLTLLPTDAGPVWVKACARAFAHEGPLLQTLDRLAPGSVLKPLAVHRENGWLISPDGGATKSRGPADRGLFPIDGVDVAPGRPAGWDEVMRSYAALQQRLSDHVAELRETGTPYLPPERLIDVYRHYENQAPGLGPAIERTAAELARYQRLTLEHNDLFPGHVFATGGYLFDWGDAVITHPFLSARTLADPQREQYFDAWRAVSTVTDTETALAERLAPLTALAPFRTIDMSPGAPAAHFAPFIAELVDQLRRNLT